MTRVFPRLSTTIAAETNRVVQVKYTNPHDRKVMHVFYSPCGADRHRQHGFQDGRRESMLLVQEKGLVVPASDPWICFANPVFLFLDQIKREKGVW